MHLAKTDKARDALQRRDPDLSAQDRRILIVRDGRRSIDYLASLLGDGVAAPVERLLHAGYLTAAANSAERPGALPAAGHAVSTLLRRSMASMEKVQELAQSVRSAAQAPTDVPAPAATPAHVASSPAAASPPSPRRSLVAARMYMLDMLQLLRHDEAGTHAAAIRSAQGGDALVDALWASLQHIQATTSASYSQRVSERLGEVLPDEYLPRLAGSAH